MPTVTLSKAFTSVFQSYKGPESDEPHPMIDWEAIEAHVKPLSMPHTAVKCVKAAGIALMQKCKLASLGCPKCRTIALEQLVPIHGMHKCACYGHEWKVAGVCTNPIADLCPSLTK